MLGLALVLILVAPTEASDGRAVASATRTIFDELPSGRWHRVAPGESLRSLADYYYGSGRNWRTLQVANDVDLHPPVGTALWIPAARVAWGPMIPVGVDGEGP